MLQESTQLPLFTILNLIGETQLTLSALLEWSKSFMKCKLQHLILPHQPVSAHSIKLLKSWTTSLNWVSTSLSLFLSSSSLGMAEVGDTIQVLPRSEEH